MEKPLSEFCSKWIEEKNKPKPPDIFTFSIFRISNLLISKITFIGYHYEGIDGIKNLYEKCYDKWKSEGIHKDMILLPYALLGRKPTIEIIEKYTGTNTQLSNRLDNLIKDGKYLTLHFP